MSGDGPELPLSLELNKIVRQIEVDSSSKKILVRTRDLAQYTADVVIVALPLSVIKKQSVVFEPMLPNKWIAAANNIGISNICYLFIYINLSPIDMLRNYRN